MKHRISRVILFLAPAFLCLSLDSGSEKKRDNNLSVFIHGINDAVTPGWFSNANTISPATEKYIIVQDEATVRAARLATDDQYTVNTNSPTPSSASYYSSLVPADHIIHFNPDDPESVKRVKELGRNANAQVFIDMNLGVTDLSFVKRTWDKQTDWASDAAVLLAKSHAEKFEKNSEIQMYGHSAGTEVIAKAQIGTYYSSNDNEPVRFKSIVASPRTKTEGMFPDKENTTMILADGDFTYSPGGDLDLETINHYISEADAIAFAKAGYKVVRVVTEKDQSQLSVPVSVKASPVLANNLLLAMQSHTIANSLPGNNLALVAYTPGTANAYPVSGISLGKLAGEISKAGALENISDIQKVTQDLKKEEPSEGLGGISLNAIADIPIDPEDVSEANYDRNGSTLFLVMKHDDVIRFPAMNPEVLRLAYETGYLRDEKPELSIGSSPFRENGFEKQTIPNPPGMFSVYYLGGTENTYLGLAMYLADEALGSLAFGSTAEVNSISSAVPGFHSLPELFPAKYTDNPAAQRYIEADTRVFLNTSRVELKLDKQQTHLSFGAVDFTVSMSTPGSAEKYYADFFSAHFHKIAATKQGAPLQNLIPFAKAVAIFRWMKTNNIRFNPGTITEIPVTKVYTPRYSKLSGTPTLADVNPTYPTILFGPFGPTAFCYSADKKTTVTYSKGRPEQVNCWNGQSITIRRDGLGVPLSYQASNAAAGVFYIHPQLGPVFYKNVILENGSEHTGATVTDKTVIFPQNQPEAVFGRILSEFIRSNEPK